LATLELSPRTVSSLGAACEQNSLSRRSLARSFSFLATFSRNVLHVGKCRARELGDDDDVAFPSVIIEEDSRSYFSLSMRNIQRSFRPCEHRGLEYSSTCRYPIGIPSRVSVWGPHLGLPIQNSRILALPFIPIVVSHMLTRNPSTYLIG